MAEGAVELQSGVVSKLPGNPARRYLRLLTSGAAVRMSNDPACAYPNTLVADVPEIISGHDLPMVQNDLYFRSSGDSTVYWLDDVAI